MGTATDGQICYGIAFEEEFEFPWSEYDDIEDWWVFTVLGFKHAVEIYNSEGECIDGARPAQALIEKYYSDIHVFKKAHPLPVKIVTYCSGDYPKYIIAVPGTCISCSRGEWVEFDPTKLVVIEEQKAALLQFCSDYGIEHEQEPQWLLTSYWG